MSSEQNKERLSCATRRDGYFSYVSTRDSEVQEAKEHNLDHHAYLRLGYPTPTAWSQQCKTPPPSVSTHGAPTTCNGKTSASALNLSARTTATAKKNNNNHSYFHVVPVKKVDIQETKLQTKSEEHFRAVPKYLEEARKSYYTYNTYCTEERPGAMHKLPGVWTHQGILFTSNSLCSLWRLPQFG